ncbi:hypothetical protein EIN_224170 [Entamoeba invadens IP1]|uniref:MHD domain-containing protein n=2 Tax=Entamoeba invadens TaxID=33085 RepID=A0A0A1U2B7_ENTIV|nr:hypothetical protein EIN_224170 [Entamoeba invadens IP1]ELP88174.1 hypothetical protein EIN_224170 [Entamoeba invadens IP1]BAN40737.1 hypothetical protein [Entamoeba invadens]|eukprot:XP_004254945.1 hypothetical protein EIN_224170 [Entamoeba invadens IP1]
MESVVILNTSGDVLFQSIQQKYLKCIDFYVQNLLNNERDNFVISNDVLFVRYIRNGLHFLTFTEKNYSVAICISLLQQIATAIGDLCNGTNENEIRTNLIRVSEIIDELTKKISLKPYHIVSPLVSTFSLSQMFSGNENDGIFVEHIETLSSNGNISGIINIKSSVPQQFNFVLKHPEDVVFYGTKPQNGFVSIPLLFGTTRVLSYKMHKEVNPPFLIQMKVEKNENYIKFVVSVTQRVIGKCYLIFHRPSHITTVRTIDGNGVLDLLSYHDKVRYSVIGTGSLKFSYQDGVVPCVSDFPFVTVEFEAEKTIVSGTQIIRLSPERKETPVYLKQATKQGSWTIRVV